MIFLDSCVISETIKPEPSPLVLSWIDSLAEERVYIPALVIGEMVRGAAKLAAGKRRDAFLVWLEQLQQRFSGRIVPFDGEVAARWAFMTTELEKKGRVLPLSDGMIAASALHYNAILATRNTSDFKGTGIRLINPWEWEN